MEYSTGLFAINFFHFLDSLRETNLIVIVGYSFGDKGINTAIIEWMYSNEINRIILIHGDLDGLKQKARWAIGSRLETWIGNKRILRLPKWVQAVGWVEIKTLLTADF